MTARDFYTFQQDNVSTRRAHKTADLLTRETPDFVPPKLWPPNSQNLNLVDYKVWSVMQKKVYIRPIKDIEELRLHVLKKHKLSALYDSESKQTLVSLPITLPLLTSRIL